MGKFMDYSPEQAYLLPPSVQDVLGADSRNASLYNIYTLISRAFCRIGEGIGRDSVGF